MIAALSEASMPVLGSWITGTRPTWFTVDVKTGPSRPLGAVLNFQRLTSYGRWRSSSTIATLRGLGAPQKSRAWRVIGFRDDVVVDVVETIEMMRQGACVVFRGCYQRSREKIR